MSLTTIAMDPPWAERGGGQVKRGADRHYPVMLKSAVARAVLDSGVFRPDVNGCSLWIWATVNHLPDALWLMSALDATYVTNAVWVKARPAGTSLDRTEVVIPEKPGLGQRMRICHELLLYGRIGMVPTPAPADRLPSTIYAPRGRHSEKPHAAYELIERHDPPGERLEMFARRQRPGWTVWGNEVGGE